MFFCPPQNTYKNFTTQNFIFFLILALLFFPMQIGCDGGAKVKSRNAKKYFEAAKKYDKAGNVKKAVEHYSKAIKENPKYAMAYYRRAVLYDNHGSSDKAIRDYKKFMQLDKQKDDIYPAQRLAAIYAEKGDRANEQKYIAEIQKRQQRNMSKTRSNNDDIRKTKKRS
ncbi:MAG: tetratricopeptide repeat protein [Planctomycetia bacterium]|nr:tetratricopeptide repeat protein [Planctomycetia bacterium]